MSTALCYSFDLKYTLSPLASNCSTLCGKRELDYDVEVHKVVNKPLFITNNIVTTPDHIRAYQSHSVNQTPNIGMWIVYHSLCKVWASCR